MNVSLDRHWKTGNSGSIINHSSIENDVFIGLEA